MNNTIQKQLSKIEDEIKALKAVFDKNATKLPVFTKELDFTTSENVCTMSQSGGYSYSFSGGERVIVEFRTVNGLNTLADLEYTWSQGDNVNLPKCFRIPFNGGVAWEVSGVANTSGDGWQATTYNFKVNSAVDGVLTARMIWQ